MQGLYYPDGSFRDEAEIKRELALKEPPEPTFVTPRSSIEKPFSYWSARARRRQSDYMETQERNTCVEIELPDTSLISFLADQHIGGADIVVSGHWHTKGISQQPFQGFGGESQIATMIALGTYKASDEYIRTYGFNNRDPKSMYGATVKLDKERHIVTPYYDTIEAHREFTTTRR